MLYFFCMFDLCLCCSAKNSGKGYCYIFMITCYSKEPILISDLVYLPNNHFFHFCKAYCDGGGAIILCNIPIIIEVTQANHNY